MLVTAIAGSSAASSNLIKERNTGKWTRNVAYEITAIFTDSLWTCRHETNVVNKTIPMDYEYLKKLIANIGDDISVEIRSSF